MFNKVVLEMKKKKRNLETIRGLVPKCVPQLSLGSLPLLLKQRPFWATQVNRKRIFQIVSMRVKAYYEEKASLPVDVRRSKTPSLLTNNRPLPGSKNPHFQNQAKCTTFLVKMSFICMRMKNLLHIKGWALNLVLIQRRGETWNWPIGQLSFPVSFNSPRSLSESFLGPVSSRF